MAGEFMSPVAKQDPNISTQEFVVTWDKLPNIDTEKNRYIMKINFENGHPMDPLLIEQQCEFLPTTATSLMNIDY